MIARGLTEGGQVNLPRKRLKASCDADSFSAETLRQVRDANLGSLTRQKRRKNNASL
jgi:hypothetical protein